MTIQSPTARASFVCNGVSTVFPVNIQAYLATDFLVLVTNAAGSTTLTLNSDYTLVASGSLTPTFWSLTTQTGQFVSPYVTGNTLQVILNPSETQLSQYTQGQAFPSLAMQTNLDRLTQMVIREGDQLSRAITAPDGDVSPVMTLPNAALRASKNLGFDPSGNVALNLALASGTISTASLAPFLGLSITAAETASAVTPANLAYQPGNVLRYGANATPGVTDMTAVIQAAFNQMAFGGAQVSFPAGVYLISTGPITVPQACAINITGAGMGLTAISHAGVGDCFQLFNGPTTGGPGNGQITIKGMTVQKITANSTGAAFNLRAAGILPSVTMEDVFVYAGGGTHWTNGIITTTTSEQSYLRVLVYGSGAAMNGIQFVQVFAGGTETNDSTVIKVTDCSIYNVNNGVIIQTQTLTGIQGVQFTGVEITGALTTGVLYTGPVVGVGYFPPQLSWMGGQIDATFRGFDLTNVLNFFCQGAMFFNRGGSSASHIELQNAGQVSIIGNEFLSVGAGTGAEGVTFGSSQPALNGGVISDNYFQFPGSTESAVNLIATGSNTFQNLSVTGNVRQGGGITVNTSNLTSAGQNFGTILIRDNQPVDGADIFDTTITPTAGANTIAGKRAKYFILGSPGGAVTVTSLISRNADDECFLLGSSANITLQNNNTNPDGFSLQGGANYTFGAGTQTKIHLKKLNGGFWTEVARD